ncbi:hypothetical protein CEUSTIGMA_g10992.t1 [Chlamydomonas eustigma]|uniref:Ubiquitin-like domain-containing protein n=1 Tax=Chlamydomonas eustigma TaxID=1157962 RepID=A0A250XKI6_9CHLO|nr:hypothetical protein CEUSTIGMA_g10992.t1 [Chlamydomonas eustigma]|eukprot:GAX83567.1 hypothetical protein CEUSTIGMA_g10992.t1 [Chlamydomonas eustigma]
MVLLHMKRSDLEQFLFETTVEASVKDTIKQLSTVHNLRQKIQRLRLEGEELAKYGPAKEPGKEGIDTYSEDSIQKGPFYMMDPTGRRTGNACSPDVSKVLIKTLEEATAVAHKDQVTKKVVLTEAMLKDAIDNIRGAVMICYPMGLPEWDLVRENLEDKEDLSGTSFAAEEMDPETSTLWFAGKQMLSEKSLKDYLGRHEKTKVIVKLQKKGAGAPGREPVTDQETQKAMMAWYYKKQEEQKKLVEDDDDSYTGATWASNQSLKAHFSGVSAVRLPR